MKPLLFVYNADSGMANALADLAHKLISPKTYACNLCAVTYSALGMRGAWKRFLEGLGRPVEFLHRDEFHERFGQESVALPAAFLRDEEELETLIDAEAMGAVTDVEDLKRLLRDRLASPGAL